MSRQTRGGNLTIRQGTGEKYWYTQAGYIAASVIVVAYVFVTWDATGGDAVATGITMGLLMILLVVLGLGTYVALFKDNAYIRGQYRGWSPRWWYYIGAGIGTPLVVFFAARALGEGDIGGAVALMVFVVSTLGMNVSWIYNRHRYIGIP